MPRLIIIIFLLVGASIISNAAGIYDNSLINADKKNEKQGNVNVHEIHFLNDDLDKTSSEYNIALSSILKENKIRQKIQDKPLSYNKSYLADADTADGNFIQAISNDEINAQALLETVMVWTEVKRDLNYINDISNAIDTWEKQFFDEYMDEKQNPSLVLTTNIQTITYSKDKPNLLKTINRLSNLYQGDANKKYQDNYKVPSSYNYNLNTAYENHNDGEKIVSEKNFFSIIYLWSMYSDIIIAAISLLIITIVISSLIRILSNNK